MAREKAEVRERGKMSLVIALSDVQVATNWLLQRRCRKNVVPISGFYEKLNHLQSISQTARDPKHLCDIARCAFVFHVYFAQFL